MKTRPALFLSVIFLSVPAQAFIPPLMTLCAKWLEPRRQEADLLHRREWRILDVLARESQTFADLHHLSGIKPEILQQEVRGLMYFGWATARGRRISITPQGLEKLRFCENHALTEALRYSKTKRRLLTSLTTIGALPFAFLRRQAPDFNARVKFRMAVQELKAAGWIRKNEAQELEATALGHKAWQAWVELGER